VSVVPSLDGVTDITVVGDPVAHGGMPRGRLAPSLLPGLGVPGPRAIGAAAEGVTTAFSHQQGMCIGVIPVVGGHWLGQPRGRSTMPGSRAFGLLLKVTRRSRLASCSHSLVFRSGMSEMSSSR
jgi:hypothetical protein